MRASSFLFLLVALAALHGRVAGDEGSSSNDVRPCSNFFKSIQGQLGSCKDVLSHLTSSNDTYCPDVCRGMFKDLPEMCATFVNRTLPPSYKGPPAAGDGSEPFDICDRMYCPEHEEECGIQLQLLRSLDLFRLPYLVGSGGAWNEVTVKTSSTNIGAIVAAVVAGNAVMFALVGGFMWLRRRHKRRRRALELLPPGAPPGVGGSPPSSSDLGTSKLKDPLDSAEMGGTTAAREGKVSADGGRAVPISVATAAAVVGAKPGGLAGGVADGSAFGASDSGASSSRIGVTTPPSPFSTRGVAQLWAAAAQGAAVGGWGHHPPSSSSPLSYATTTATNTTLTAVTEHMQQDELEMLQLGGAAAAGEQQGARDAPDEDPLLSWVNSQVAQQAQQAQQQQQAPEGSRAQPEATAQPPEQQQQPDSGEGVREASRGALSLAPSGVLGSQRLSSGLVDLKPWQIKYSDLKIQRPLGEGSFGKVFLATWNETLVAVKLLLTNDDIAAASKSRAASLSLPLPVMDELNKEAGLMASLRHPNVVLFLGVCASPPAVVTEYCSRGSLLDVLRAAQALEQAAQQLTWVRRLSMALDAAKGMLCLHAHNPPIVHRDLKSPNLLVDAAWRVKVCDFNLSKLLEDSARSSSASGMLNPRWLAPEVLMGQKSCAASDVFSFGTVLWELLTWQLPWEGANLYQLVFMVSRGERLAIPPADQLPGPDQLPEAELAAYISLIQRCWAQEPTERPTFAEAITELRAIMSRLVSGAAQSVPAGTPA